MIPEGFEVRLRPVSSGLKPEGSNFKQAKTFLLKFTLKLTCLNYFDLICTFIRRVDATVVKTSYLQCGIVPDLEKMKEPGVGPKLKKEK